MKHGQLPLLAALTAFILLCLGSGAAREGAGWAVELCLKLLIPSLLPFFAAAGLVNRLGLSQWLEKHLGAVMGRLFGVSGAGAGAFLLGLTGGYPLGAATAAALYEEGKLSREEAEALLGFCDNTGPSFALAAVGLGAFHSLTTGLFLYLVHIAAAILTGLLLAPRRPFPAGQPRAETPLPPFSAAFTSSVLAAARAVGSVCAFVVVFSAFLYALDAQGLFASLTALLSAALGWELQKSRALLWSMLELSGAVGLMAGLAPTPVNLALAAFALGWGGLCVHCQSMGVSIPAGLSGRRRLGGKLLHGILSAGLAYIMSTLYLVLSGL